MKIRPSLIFLHFALMFGLTESSHGQRQPDFPATPPEEICIRMPEGKSISRDLLGTEGVAYPYQYTYDENVFGKGQLRNFEIGRTANRQIAREAKMNWSVTSDVGDGELFFSLGQVYRWDGKTSKMIRVPGDPRANANWDRENEVAVVQRANIGWVNDPDVGFQFDVEEFDSSHSDVGDRISVWLPGDQKGKLKRPDTLLDNNNVVIWMKCGDHVQSPNGDLKLTRIIMPDPTEKNPGWAEFTVEHLNPPKKGAK
jgi:hypothetical protein